MDTSYYPYAALSCASFLTFYRTVSPAVSVKYFPIYGSLPHAKQVEWNTRLVVTVFDINTHPFNGPFSGTTQVGRYQKGKTNLDFTGARDSEWQWHQLGHVQVCTSLQTDNHASTPPLSFLQAGCPSCRQTNSVKALKALFDINISQILFVFRTVVDTRKHYLCVRFVEPWNNLNCATVDFSSLRRFKCFLRQTDLLQYLKYSDFSKLQ